MKRVFIAQSFDQDSAAVHSLVDEAVKNAGGTLSRSDKLIGTGSLINQIYSEIETCDLIICDITNSNPNVMYELGYVHALERPVILISQRDDRIPFNVMHFRVLFYGIESSQQRQEFSRTLTQSIVHAFENPEHYSRKTERERKANSVFISYSHVDKEYLDRLQIHLKPLHKKGVIELWDDTRIKTGEKWKEQIENALARARVAILIVSADFLASDFIVDNELPPLLKVAESEGVKIIPVIAKPCGFTRDENLSVFQSINSPDVPITSMDGNEREKTYDQIASEIEAYFRGQ